MPGTARLADVGSHGNVMASASGDVITNGRGTHRMTDLTVCPIHGPQVTIANVATTVLTNNLPTAHLGSISTCGPPAVIVSASGDTIVE